MTMRIPKSHYVYEFSYPEGMPALADIIFYVGKGTSLFRMDAHFTEAAGGCDCDKCKAIRSVWDAGLVVVRRIVFETTDEQEAKLEESSRIALHRSPYLTNVQGGWGTRRVAKVEENKQAVEPPWMRSFEEHGETWLCMTEALNVGGTRILQLAEEYGLTKQVRGYTTYYRKSELPGFWNWANTNYPSMFRR
jgi:hypothetical protein